MDEDVDGYVIVDYKTGNPKSQKLADDSLQLSVYAIAMGPEKPVKTLIFQNLANNSTIDHVALAGEPAQRRNPRSRVRGGNRGRRV